MDFYRFLWIFPDFYGFEFGPMVPKNPKYRLEKNQYIHKKSGLIRKN